MISCFAIVILSVIGALFKANHHSMTGTLDDPQNPAAVAATVFSAVGVYVVRLHLIPLPSRFPSPVLPSYATQESLRDKC